MGVVFFFFVDYFMVDKLSFLLFRHAGAEGVVYPLVKNQAVLIINKRGVSKNDNASITEEEIINQILTQQSNHKDPRLQRK